MSLYNLPVTLDESKEVSFDDVRDGYAALNPSQRLKWRQAAAKGGCLFITPYGEGTYAIKLCMTDPVVGGASGNCWDDNAPELLPNIAADLVADLTDKKIAFGQEKLHDQQNEFSISFKENVLTISATVDGEGLERLRTILSAYSALLKKVEHR